VTLSSRELCTSSAIELADALASGATSSVEIVTSLMERIADIDAPGSEIELRSVLALAPDALGEAPRLDDERALGTLRSRLHGVPILIKDNIEAVDCRAVPDRRRYWVDPSPMTRRSSRDSAMPASSFSVPPTSHSGPTCVHPFRRAGGRPLGVSPQSVSPGPLRRGSSSGSGAALAARLTPLAIGN